MKPPLELEEAQQRLLALASPLPVQHVEVPSALGRWLAEPLLARLTRPAADCSSMDGYAVRAAELGGPWRVIGESAAGRPFADMVGAGEAVRVSTGATMPSGADAVVMQEDVARTGDRLVLTGTGPPSPSAWVRGAGSDFRAGEELARAGTRIGAAQVALALAAGHRLLPVRRAARIAILDCGDELAADPEACAPHQVPASNGAMLAAMLAGLACDVSRIGPVRDDRDALAAALGQADRADVLVTSGGASVGDHDLIRPALEAWGAELDFWRVAIRPGKPLLVARRGAQLVIGLPGNPVSSYVTAILFLLPLVRALGGARESLPRPIRATLGAPLGRGGQRREFLRARLDGGVVVAEPVQDSGGVAALARSNALIDRAASAPAEPAGAPVDVLLFGNG